MCYYSSDCPSVEYCCDNSYCASSCSYSVGAGAIAGIVIALIIAKISIIACCVYAWRRRTVGYIVAPNPQVIQSSVVVQAQAPYPYPTSVVPPHYNPTPYPTGMHKPPPAYSQHTPYPVQA